MQYRPPPDIPPEIVYQDNWLLVVNKPSGLLSVPGRGDDKQDCLLTRLQRDFPDAIIVHRLDMSTSGLMILARNKNTERALSILFQQRKVKKEYIAVTSGKLAPSQGMVELPLLSDWPNRPRQKVDFVHGKPSQTGYKVLQYDSAKDCSRLALYPVTGRSHQLRVHMQTLGYPILGDELYANKKIIAQSSRLLLHASQLEFVHPHSKQKMVFHSKPDF